MNDPLIINDYVCAFNKVAAHQDIESKIKNSIFEYVQSLEHNEEKTLEIKLSNAYQFEENPNMDRILITVTCKENL